MFNTISDNVSSELIEKKSKFIANAFQVKSEEEAKNKINEISKKYYDAKHNCFAYIISDGKNIIEKASDNGEPSGTAGKPILNILKSKNLQNVLVIVTRYFGGILLGTGGLTRAYSNSAKFCIEQASIIKQEPGNKYKISASYSEIKNIQYELEKNNIQIEKIEYGENVEITFNVLHGKNNDMQEMINKSQLIEKNILINVTDTNSKPTSY